MSNFLRLVQEKKVIIQISDAGNNRRFWINFGITVEIEMVSAHIAAIMNLYPKGTSIFISEKDGGKSITYQHDGCVTDVKVMEILHRL